MKWWRALPGLAAMGATRASAQIDYRNLHDARPVAVEDAYPLERYAFEWLGAYRFARLGEGSQHLFVPELAYGIARGTELGIKAPFAATTLGGSTEAGLARSEEHTSELQSHSFISYAVFCLKTNT